MFNVMGCIFLEGLLKTGQVGFFKVLRKHPDSRSEVYDEWGTIKVRHPFQHGSNGLVAFLRLKNGRFPLLG